MTLRPPILQRRSRRALLSSIALATLCTGRSWAGEADTAATVASTSSAASPGAEAASADASTLNELVVTARHESEKALDVPIALSAVPKETLQQTNAYTLTDLQTLVPSLTTYQSNARNSSIGIRGIGVSSAADGLDTTVGVYMDGVYLGRPGMALEDLVDVDQVEVLRGPQGTLFGRNSAAGVVNITTSKPTFTPEETVEASYGDYNFEQLKLSLSGPVLGDEVAVRLTAFVTHRDGVLPNTLTGGSDNSIGREGGRFQVLITPTSKLSIRLIADASVEDDTCCVSVLNSLLPTNLSTSVAKTFAAFATLGYTPVATTAYTQINSPQDMRTNQHSVSGEVDYDLGWAQFTSITAYRYWHFDPLQDSDGTPLDIIQVNVAQTRDNQYSQEFRLSGKTGRLSWQTGVYLFDEELKDHYILNQFGYQAQAFYSAYNGKTWTPTITPGSQYIGDTSVNEKSAAVFGQANFNITDRLILTGGLRYTYDSKIGSTYTSYAGTPYISASQTPLFTDPPTRVSGGNLSYLVSLSYKVTQDLMTYVSRSTGYQAAGLNLNSAPVPGHSIILQPETVGDWEVGVKSSLFDHRLSVNVDAFWETLDGLQANIVPAGGGKSYLANVGNIVARGVEAEADWKPTSGLLLSANGAYNDTYYSSYPNAPAPAGEPSTVTLQNLTGSPVYQAPRWEANLLARYDWDLGRRVSPYVQAQYSYRSGVFGDVQDSPGSRIPGYSLANARVGARFGCHYDVALWVENLTNTVYFQTMGVASISPGGGQYGFGGLLGPPRTFGATVRATF
ncbi:MAG TPA: TonB-dependent receptor [Caulobacteraceae bacterium]|jgi:iron complex outermembrane receptor protein